MHRAISLDVCDYTNTLVCNLYDSTNDISGQATDVFVHTERNGFKELKFKLPSVTEDGERNYRLDWLIADYKIRLRSVKTNEDTGEKTTEIDWFLISESRVTHNNFSMDYDIKASHISQLLNTKNLGLEFSDDEGNNTGTIKEIAATILEGTGWHLGYVATFLEEDKYNKTGTKKEKVRSFTASSKTGAFKMMNDLCEIFDAKPIYHGEGTYTDENGQEQVGRTVDIIPMNPFSKDLAEGAVPQEVLEGESVLALYYDKNVSGITRTLNTDHLVTVLSAYGAYGDIATGIVSLQTCEHAEITFGSLAAGTYHFEYLDGQYYFTTNKNTIGLRWSYIDLISRTYVFDGTNLFRVTKEAPASYTTITGTIEYVRNYLSFVMDFSYYQKIGLLTDEHLLEIAKLQWNLPKKYAEAEESSLSLSSSKAELSKTASDGNGFLMFDIQRKDINKGNVRLKLKKTDAHSDGVIFRSDYDEAKRNYFTWTPATGMTSANSSVGGRGAVFYIVHNTTPTKWEKAYLKAVGTTEYDYYRDDLNNIYALSTEKHYDHKTYEAADPTGTYFPTAGEEGYIYVADDTKKMYVWRIDTYTEIRASSYYYGTNDFEYPDTVTLWTTNTNAWTEGDKVYMFSSNSIAGLFGPREDQLAANKENVETETKSAGTVSHPVVFIDENGSAPSVTICGTDGYGWYYKSASTSYNFGTLYFCYAGAGDNAWQKVYVSNNANDGEEVAQKSGYGYYYSCKRQLIYKLDGTVYKRMDNNYEEKQIKSAFAVVINACNKQDELMKGVYERYNYSDSYTSLLGNYAFKGDFDNYYLFSTGTHQVDDPSKVYYDVGTSKVWVDNDQDHILTARVYNSNALDFPKANEIDGMTYTEGSLVDNVVKTTGDKFVNVADIAVYDNTNYQFSLPSGSIVVCLDSKGQTVDTFSSSPFATPNHTAKVKLVCPTKPTSSHYFCVQNYSKMFFVSSTGYTLLSCTGAGERTGMTYLMDRFIELAHEVYEVKVPLLKATQKEITDSITNLSNQLGDMYREGFWQEPKYVEGDEDQLYVDALENLNEISHPEATYDITYLDLYGSDNNLSATIETDWPDVDITYAAHLVDTDIDTNRWAYIDSIDKCYDKPWQTQLEINTRLSMIGQQSFTDVLAKIAEVANEVKAKQTVYERAKVIGSAGKIAGDLLEGLIQANKVYLLGGTSNWYTDEKGNIIFEAADGNSIMMLTGRGLMISNSRDADGQWEWRTAVSGLGINADVIRAGEFSAKHIIAGTITADKLASSVGQELEIGSNKALALYATSDGERPAGSLLTLHPSASDSWIAIGAAKDGQPAYVDIKSGGIVNIEARSKLNLVSGDQLYIGVDRTLTDEFNDTIVETVRVYKNGTSKTTPPSLNQTGTQEDSTWKVDVQPVTTSNKYLWSRNRYKTKDGRYSYGTATYEGELSNKVATDHPEYIRTKANASAPSATASGWSASIPTLEDDSDLVWVWVCDAVTNTNGTFARYNIRHDGGLDTMTNATLTALNIASGKVGVPKVDATGIYIADNLLQVKSTGRVDVLGNASVNIGTSSSNSAVVLNKDGISIASQKNLAIASGGKLTIDATDLVLSSTPMQTILNGIDSKIDENDENTIVETVRVYRLGTSNTTAPSLKTDGTLDSNWTVQVPTVTVSSPYLWSVTRFKKKKETYSYSTPIYEGYLTVKVDQVREEYIRTSTTTAPSATDNGWKAYVPAPTYDSEGKETNQYVWVCTATKNNNTNTYVRTNIRRDTGLESLSGSAIKAINIASGKQSVPWVETTGLSIKDNSLTLTAVDTMKIAANTQLDIQNAAGNNQITLNQDGIAVGSKGSIAIASGGKLTLVSGDQLYIGSNKTLSGTLTDIQNAEIDETVRVYQLGTSSSTAPTVKSDGTLDSNWTVQVKTVTADNPYLWARTRYKKRDGTYSYSSATYEGYLTDKVDQVKEEYIRTSTTTKPSATADGWASYIPAPTYDDKGVQTNKYVWVCTATKKKNSNDYVRTNIRREYGLESFSESAIDAINIATGKQSVPWVETTGLSIKGNDLQLTAVSTMKIAANTRLDIQNASGNNQITLKESGISIGSGADIAVVAGGTVTIGSGTKPFVFESDSKGGADSNIARAYLYNGVTGITDTSHDGIYLGTDGIVLGKGVFKVSNAGFLTSTDGKIANWYIKSSFIANNTSVKTSTVGIGDGTYALWAGKANTQTDISKSLVYIANDGSVKFGSFSVNSSGNASCSSLSISGGSITIKDGSTENFKVTTKGILTAKSVSLSGEITAGSFNNGDGTFSVTSAGAVTASNISISGGSISIKDGTTENFKVTNKGILTAKSVDISGKITATSGEIAKWTINTSSLTGNKTGMAKTTNDTDIAFWAGNATASSGAFKVTQAGAVTCSNLSMTGGSIDGSDITVSVKSLSVKSSGTVDFSAASSFKIKAGAITMAAISDPPDLSTKYDKISQIQITSAGIDIDGSKYVHMRAGTGTYAYIDPGLVDIKTTSGSSVSQVIINKDGITMGGNRLVMNGRILNSDTFFGRDDIRIVTSSKSEATIISEMASKHDWVLIKPYYNANIRYLYDGYYRSTSTAYNTNVVNMPQDAGGGATAFGQGASWYRYVLTGTLERSSGESSSSGCQFIARLSNYASLSGGVATTASINTTPTTITFSIDSGQVTVNLCAEGSLIYLRLDTQYSYEKISNLRLTCTCDATTSRVPCTVYYYP